MIFANTTEADVPVNAKEWMGEQILPDLAHVLDPVNNNYKQVKFRVKEVTLLVLYR